MLDLKFIRENPDAVRQNIINKNEKADLDLILEKDLRRRSIITEVEVLKNQRNVVSQEIANLKKNGNNADEQLSAMKAVSDKIKSMDDELAEVQAIIDDAVIRIPNMTHRSVPVGKTADENVEVRRWGSPVEQKLDHIEISKKLGILDFERGAKVSGAGFAYYVGKKIGKHLLYPQISPKKTLEGAIGGFCVAIIFSVSIALLADHVLFACHPFKFNLWQAPLMGAVVSIAAQLGDLC